VEALDGDVIRVATIAEVFGRVALMIYDDQHHKRFFDRTAVDVFPIGWSERTSGCLFTPYGPVDFRKKVPLVGVKAKKW